VHPILFHLGSLELPSHPTLLSLSFLLGGALFLLAGMKRGASGYRLAGLVLVVQAAAFAGSRALFVLSEGTVPLSDALALRPGGVALNGGVIGALLLGWVYVKASGWSFWTLADWAAPSLALGVFLTKVGCFLSGCCYGHPTNLPWGVRYPVGSEAGAVFGSRPLHPAPLYEGLAGLALLGLLAARPLRSGFAGRRFLVFGVLYLAVRALNDLARGDVRPGPSTGLTQTQWFSLALGAVAAGVLVRRWRASRTTDRGPACRPAVAVLPFVAILFGAASAEAQPERLAKPPASCYAAWSPAEVQAAVSRYVNAQGFRTHEEANRAGLPWGARVYGETLRPGARFSPQAQERSREGLSAVGPASTISDPCLERFVQEVVKPSLLPLLAGYEWAEPSRFQLVVEQDSLIPPSSDKDYTMGVILEWNGGWVDRSFLARGMSWLDWPGKHLHRAQAGLSERFAFQFGNSAFAPLKENLGRTDPIYDDRPYASLLFITIRRTTVSDFAPDRSRRAVTSEWTLGLLGLNISREVQTAIHKAGDDTIPGGWHNQISQGGEPTARYRLGERWNLPIADHSSGFGADLTVGGEASLGFYTNAVAEGRVRLGWRRSAWWDFQRTSPAPFLPGPEKGKRGWRPFELFAFASGGGTLWGFNELLRGGFRDSAVELDFGKDPAPMKRTVADWQFGATLAFWKISLTYVESRHTALFGGPNERQHRWRTLSLGF